MLEFKSNKLHFYAAICVNNLRRSGVLISETVLSDGIGKLEVDGFVLLGCHNYQDAKLRVKVEKLERTQCEFSLLHLDLALLYCEYELASILGNLESARDFKQDIEMKQSAIDTMKRIRNGRVYDLALGDNKTVSVFRSIDSLALIMDNHNPLAQITST
ncbi:hypothetical protein VA249_45480 (plasmid) [Vibrio alfacsensis]|uniref:hypothetical protein n=1 Tax=Vibrio alfacsensis TaxID=1074311 RepID=UPI001BEFE6CB|nr:hypothetical protein [Vibrio alfacsensis]BBM67902.1 hypothetical protein VA249_45480 [Vibrio alfacsensis]